MGKGGEMQVKIPSLDAMVDVDRLTPEQIEELKEMNVSDSDVYKQQLTVAEKANQYLATIDTGIRKMVRKGGGDTKGMFMASLSQQIGDKMKLLTDTQMTALASGDAKQIQAVLKDLQFQEGSVTTGTTAGDATSKGWLGELFNGLKNMGIIPEVPLDLAQDFILRPGAAPVKFAKDDLLIGGTGLMNGTENITNKISNASAGGGGGGPGKVELTGTLMVRGEGETAKVDVKRLFAQLNSGDLQNLSIMLANATA